jgi:ferredoxin-thioredoxin reductase catalytic subunit
LDNFDPIKESLELPKDEKDFRIDILKKKLTILYYGLRFIFSIMSYSVKDKTKSKGFYFNLISKNIISELDKSYIPGNFQNITTKINTYYEAKGILKISPKKYGAYICPCGRINSYKFSSSEINCPFCNKVFSSNKNFIRIFFDAETREEILNNKNINKDFPNMLLSELEQEIEQEKNVLQKGIKPVEFDTLMKKEEKVRNMNQITYRTLNFILYSFIYYGNKIGYINESNVKKYVNEKGLNVDSEKYYNYFTEGNWIDSKGQPVKNWKQKLLTWSGFSSTTKEITKKSERKYTKSELDKFYAN